MTRENEKKSKNEKINQEKKNLHHSEMLGENTHANVKQGHLFPFCGFLF